MLYQYALIGGADTTTRRRHAVRAHFRRAVSGKPGGQHHIVGGKAGKEGMTMKKQKLPKRWMTRDGVIIKLKKMSLSHIENCMRLLERKHDAITESALSNLNGEMALASITDEFYPLEQLDLYSISPMYAAFSNELDRRHRKA